MIIIMILIVLFLIIGSVFVRGKGTMFIAGYNRKSEKEKEQYDEVKLTKFTGKIMYLLSVWMLLWVLSEFLNSNTLLMIGFILFVGTILFASLYVNSSKKFKKNDKQST